MAQRKGRESGNICGKGFIFIWCCLVSVLFAFEKKIRCAFVWCNVLNDRFTLAASVIQIFHIFINFFPLFLYYSSTEKDCIFSYNCGFACFFFCFCHIFSSCKSKLHYVHTHVELLHLLNELIFYHYEISIFISANSSCSKLHHIWY